MILQYLSYCPVASVIFAITIGLSLLAFNNERLYNDLMLHPYSVHRGRKVYTVLTSGFIHRDWGHLFFNMLTYYFFAFALERIIGHWQFAFLYIVSLLLSDMPTVFKQKDNFGYRSLGASGAIAAVIFSMILYYPLGEISLYYILPIKMYIFGPLYLIYCVYASKNSHDTINHDAHFFGALSGLFLTIILNHEVLPESLRQLGVRG